MPATPSDTLVGVEKDMNGLCDAGNVGNFYPLSLSPSFPFHQVQFQIVRIVLCSKMSQQCAITISNFNIVHFIRLLQLKICEVDVDDVAFGNLDGLPLVKVVGVVEGEVGRIHVSTCWQTFRFFR